MTLSAPAPAANRLRLHQTLRDIAILFAVAAVLALTFAAVRSVRTNAAGSWPTVPGVITQSDIQTVAIPGRMIRYVPAVQIAYTYSVAGQRLTGTTVSLETTPILADTPEAERLLMTYPVGAAVDVRVNPADPTDSVLEAVPPTGAFVPALILLGLALGTGLLALVVRP